MRRLRRAHQKHLREQTKRRKRFKQRAVAAGTAAAITLGAGMSINKALADDHQLPVSQDADADLLANKEELAIGYRVFEPDQNRNQIPDGVELAKRCAADINDLPIYDPYSGEPEPNETYKIEHLLRGGETCDICSASVNMGGVEIINPKLGLRNPDPNGPLIGGEFLPFLALHYMEHGSFDCFGHFGVNEPGHVGRVDIPRLLRVLELRYPYEPNDHQLPLDYVAEPHGQLAPDANDLDGDLLADSEELEAGYNLYDPDQDDDLTPDGIELAKQCAEAFNKLPNANQAEPNETYKGFAAQWGLEICDICGEVVNMGGAWVTNPRLGLTVEFPILALHYMQHGSFSYAGDVHTGRADVALLVKALEIPRHCGDLGTMYRPSDLNRDCNTNFVDLASLVDKWLQSTDPSDDGGIEY